MNYRKRTIVKSAATGPILAFFAVVTPILVVTLGPVAGILAAGIGIPCAFRTASNHAEDKMKGFYTKEHEQKLLSSGYHNIKMTQMNGADNNPLMSAIFGNEITVRTKYSRK